LLCRSLGRWRRNRRRRSALQRAVFILVSWRTLQRAAFTLM
jgi:hypothetical protein